MCHATSVCDSSTIRDAYLAHAAELKTGDADGRRLARDVERFVAEMLVALTRRRALTVELRQDLERENGAAGAKADGPAKGKEVLHGARPLRPKSPVTQASRDCLFRSDPMRFRQRRDAHCRPVHRAHAIHNVDHCVAEKLGLRWQR